MGTVHAKIKLDNPKRARLKAVETNALVDTGSLFLCLPEEVCHRLQLEESSKKEVTTADGKRCLCPYVGPVRVQFENRECYVGAVVLGDEVLLGAVPMEDMDLVVIPSVRRLVVNPLHPNFAAGPAKQIQGSHDDLQKRIQAALANPQNMGEMAGADSIGTVGNADCGEMLRLWVKFKQQDGKRVIDRATFQSFGCETAIAVASLATELIRGKTAEEALALKTEELAGELGPLPPMKIHCAQLVEGALRSALESSAAETKIPPAPANAPTLLDNFSKPKEGVKLTFLD
jgi:clan AA aspartic protease